jgi:hypothetical protein
MNRVQFVIVTSLAGIVALCIILQFFLSMSLGAKEANLRQAGGALQEGEADFQHLQQIATRVAQLAQTQNDSQLKDLLTRNNIQINNGTNAAPMAPAPATSAAPAPAPAPATMPSTH